MQYAVGIPDPALTLHESEIDHIDDGPALGDDPGDHGVRAEVHLEPLLPAVVPGDEVGRAPGAPAPLGPQPPILRPHAGRGEAAAGGHLVAKIMGQYQYFTVSF